MLRSNSPGDIALGPVSNTATSPPFLVGDIFSYVCVDAVNFQLFPASNALTFCEVGGSFTLDANPPTCQQTSKKNDYRILPTIKRSLNPFLFSKIDRAPYKLVRLMYRSGSASCFIAIKITIFFCLMSLIR